MHKLYNITVKWFSTKQASVLVILFAVAVRALQTVFYLDVMLDTAFQAIGTQNLMEGHGISKMAALPGNLSQAVYTNLSGWPPGNSLLLLPFYMLSGQQYLAACFLFNLTGAIFIIIFCRKILHSLNVSAAGVNLFTIGSCFFINHFYFMGANDGMAIGFFLAAIYHSLQLVKNTRNSGTTTLLIAVFLSGCISLKYLFFPVVFVIPLFLFLYGVQNRLKKMKVSAICIFVVLIAAISAVYLYNRISGASGVHISATGRGFFPEHLERTYSLFPSSFITPNTLSIVLGSMAGSVINILRLAHLLIYLLLFYLAASLIFRSRFKQLSLQHCFFILAFGITTAICATLITLSLFIREEYFNETTWWTYVEDARYYGLAEILVHLTVMIAFFSYRKHFKRPVRYLVTILPFLVLPEIVRGTSFTANRIINAGKENYYWQNELSFQQFANKFIADRKKKHGVEKIVVSGSKYYRNIHTSRHQHIPVLQNASLLNQPDIFKTTEPVLLLALIGKGQEDKFRHFINYPGTILETTYGGYYFYTLYITP